ncbi:PspC domain-containing protein [Phocaeicola paurosaccharolyticus]|mgnify:CR=1|jgi:phage shock protein C|uniref:PspC domain-containing protein n=1 Tax=Phocaeicola paurosaccharolyticus TaxID=732242 RepID=UPI002FDF8F7D
MENKKLYLSEDKKIAGVCGGIAEYLNCDPTVIRVIYALLTIFTIFSGVIIYLILWAVIPHKR